MRKLLVAGVALVALGCPAHADTQTTQTCIGEITTYSALKYGEANSKGASDIRSPVGIDIPEDQYCRFFFALKSPIGREIRKHCPGTYCEIKAVTEGNNKIIKLLSVQPCADVMMNNNKPHCQAE